MFAGTSIFTSGAAFTAIGLLTTWPAASVHVMAPNLHSFKAAEAVLVKVSAKLAVPEASIVNVPSGISCPLASNVLTCTSIPSGASTVAV